MSGPAPQRVARPRGDTRQRILEVALRLFAERGYAGTSIRDIAEELGVTKAAVHYHFAAKEHLVVALLDPFLAQFSALVDGAAGAPPDPRAVLLGVRDVLAEGGPLLSVLSADPSVAVALGDLHATVEALARRTAEVLAGPDPAPGRLLRAHCALACFIAGWDTAYRGLVGGTAGVVGQDELDVVVDAALAALGEPAPGGPR